jgi:hypothetical protein
MVRDGDGHEIMKLFGYRLDVEWFGCVVYMTAMQCDMLYAVVVLFSGTNSERWKLWWLLTSHIDVYLLRNDTLDRCSNEFFSHTSLSSRRLPSLDSLI